MLYKSFQLILSKYIFSEKDNNEVTYHSEDDKFRVYCDICDKLCIERFYKNPPKSGTHMNNF